MGLLKKNTVLHLRSLVPVAVVICILAQTSATEAQPEDKIVELTPVIFDDPSALILPASMFADEDGNFTIIDAASNSSRVKEYSPDGSLLQSRLPAYAAEGATVYAMSGFNPFGAPDWSRYNGEVVIKEKRSEGPVLRNTIDPGGWERDLPEDDVYRLTRNSSKYPLFSDNGLCNSDGDVKLTLELDGFTGITFDDGENIYALSSDSSQEDGYFVPVSFAISGEQVVVAGVVLPKGLTRDEFLAGYDNAYASNPDLPPEDIWHMFGFMQAGSVPLLVSFLTLNGNYANDIELGGIPLWVDTNAVGNVYVLSVSNGKTVVSRIAPDFSEELVLFEVGRGYHTLNGTTDIAVDDNAIYYDRSSISYASDVDYSEQVSIIRHSLDEDATDETFAGYPGIDGGYLVSGIDIDGAGDIYSCVMGLPASGNGTIIAGRLYLDRYDSTGSKVFNYLQDADPTIIPNAIAVTPDGNIILAAAYETDALSKPWAMLFSGDGRMLDEFFLLGDNGISIINMVAGGTIVVDRDGTIYQCDNILSPVNQDVYMRTFYPDGKHKSDLGKFSVIGSGLVGKVGGAPVLYWLNRYLLRLKGDEIVSQADLGPDFHTVDVLDVASNTDSTFILTSDGVVYSFPLDEGWDDETENLGDVETAVEALRAGLDNYISTYGNPPDKLDYQFMYDNVDDIDKVLANFYGQGPFDYEREGATDFSLLILGRDPYQTLYKVTRYGYELEF